MKRKLLSALICVAMVASVLTGCGGNGNDQAASAPATEQEAAPAETGGEEAAADAADAAPAGAVESPVAGKKVAYIMRSEERRVGKECM